MCFANCKALECRGTLLTLSSTRRVPVRIIKEGKCALRPGSRPGSVNAFKCPIYKVAALTQPCFAQTGTGILSTPALTRVLRTYWDKAIVVLGCLARPCFSVIGSRILGCPFGQGTVCYFLRRTPNVCGPCTWNWRIRKPGTNTGNSIFQQKL